VAAENPASSREVHPENTDTVMPPGIIR